MDPRGEDSSRLPLDNATFKSVNSISIKDKSPQDLVQCILDHEVTGVPLVLTGLNSCASWSSAVPRLPGPTGSTIEGRDEQNNRTVWDASALLEELSFLSDYLLSTGTATSPLVLGDPHCEVGHIGSGQAFQQTHCAATFQYLILESERETPYMWYISEASSAQQVAAHLLRAASSAPMSTPELLSCPFPLYTYSQAVGDLLILPPRCYAQTFQNGAVSFVSWSRMSHYGLELATHHELPMYRRLCHPERYGIRKMIHEALITHTAALNTILVSERQVPDSEHIDQWLQILLKLFDEVLLEGYCTDHESLNLINRAFDELVCHFCGSCLFLSCFRCVGDCSYSERDSPPGNSSIRICPTCYVEGRTCGCGSMDPERLSSLSRMLQDRNRAAEALTKLHLTLRVRRQEFVEISEGYFSWPRIAVFQAAKELLRLRKTPDVDRRGRTCTPRGREQSHSAPYASLINCKKCHAAKCFTHILQAQIHSSEALLATAVDSTSAVWHRLHQSARQRRLALPDHRTAFLSGPGKLALYAVKFTAASAVGSAKLPGFYDVSNPIMAEPDSVPDMVGTGSGSPGMRPVTSDSGPGAADSPINIGAQSIPSNQIPNTQGQVAGSADVDPGADQSGFKRGRSPESEDGESAPNKYPRLRRNPTRTLRYTSSYASVDTAIPAEIPTGLQRSEGPVRTSPADIDAPRLEDQSGGAPDNRPPYPSPNSGEMVPPLRRISRASSVNSVGPNLASMNKDPPVAFNFFNPSTDLPTPTSRSEVESFSNLLRESSVSRLGRSLAYRQDSRVEVHPQRDRLCLPSRIPRTTTYHVASSQRRSNTAAWDIFLQPPATATPFSPSHMGTHLGGGAQPRTAYVGAASINRSLSMNHLGQQGSLQQANTRHLSGQSSHFLGKEYNRSTATPGPSTNTAPRERFTKDSRELDAEAKQVLETMEGDSLSRKNVEAYLSLLNISGGLGNSA